MKFRLRPKLVLPCSLFYCTRCFSSIMNGIICATTTTTHPFISLSNSANRMTGVANRFVQKMSLLVLNIEFIVQCEVFVLDLRSSYLLYNTRTFAGWITSLEPDCVWESNTNRIRMKKFTYIVAFPRLDTTYSNHNFLKTHRLVLDCLLNNRIQWAEIIVCTCAEPSKHPFNKSHVVLSDLHRLCFSVQLYHFLFQKSVLWLLQFSTKDLLQKTQSLVSWTYQGA